MDQKELISVIVPVYKVEKYLDRCVQSIVDQTYRNLEIILVDDGSPDNSPALCDAWVEKDSRIKVIHKENGGLSDARNAGMAIATGELMGFIDSDDYIEPEMYQLLFERMKVDDSDIVACGVEMVFEDGTPSRLLTYSGEFVLNTIQAMEAIIQEKYLKQPVWYKLYKSALVRDLMFPVGKYHEDVFWSYQAVARARQVSVLDRPCYYYIQRSGSIMGEGYSLKRLDALEAKLQRLEFVRNEYPELVSDAQFDLLFSCMYHGQLALKLLVDGEKEQAVRRLSSTVGALGRLDRKKLQKLQLTHRCWLRLAKMNIKLACRVRTILGVGL